MQAWYILSCCYTIIKNADSHWLKVGHVTGKNNARCNVIFVDVLVDE